MSSKDEVRWYSQKLKKEQNCYNTTDQLKKVTILKKAEIEETDTYKTQIKKDYSDSIWTALNSDANSKDVDNWEVDMRLKIRYEHSENQHWAMHQQLLKEQWEELKKKVDDLKKQQKEMKKVKACLKLSKLMKDVWTATNYYVLIWDASNIRARGLCLLV